MKPNKALQPQNSDGEQIHHSNNRRFAGRPPSTEQFSRHSYPRLCQSCENFWKQPFERLVPFLVQSSKQHDLWGIDGPRRAAQDVRASLNFECRICCRYWESIQYATKLDGTRMVDQTEHTARYFLEWDKILLRFVTFGVNAWPQQNIHFRLLPELSKGCEADISMISKNTKGKSCWKFILEKFRTCTTAHKNCVAYSEGERWYPTRLVDISNRRRIHLVDTNSIKSSSVPQDRNSYMTLSHRWTKHTPKLTHENIASWMKNIPTNILTQTFLDAINVARCLGSHYLWIDSLCIIQNCNKDWEKESTSMGEVYRRCECNIAATAASDGSDGLFVERNQYAIPKFSVEIGWTGSRMSYSFARSDIWELGVIDSNLNRRGWVVQERLLSPRTISFGSQIFWECHEFEACETWADGLPAGLSLQSESSDIWDSNILAPKSWPRIISSPSRGSDDPYRVWKTIVRSYTNSDLTKEDDKLVALSGIAQRMQTYLNDQYIAGLWRGDLLSQLIWHTAQKDIIKRPDHYRAPSWSWASIEGRVSFPWISRPGPELCVLLEAKVFPKTNNAAGQLIGGYLKISALICQIPEEYVLRNESSRGSGGNNTNICWDVWRNNCGDFQRNFGPLYAVPIMVIDNCHYRGRRALMSLVIQRASWKTAEFRRLGLLTLSVEGRAAFEEDKVDFRLGRNLVAADRHRFSNDAEFELEGIRWENDAWVRRDGDKCGHHATITLI